MTARPTPPRRRRPSAARGPSGGDPLYEAYHDEEWGVPLHDDRALFELLCLEGAQAGLAWITILRKREGYRQAFHGFDPERVAAMSDAELDERHDRPGHRAQPAQDLRGAQERPRVPRDAGRARQLRRAISGAGSTATPIRNALDARWSQVPAVTPLAEAISKDLKKRGFTFVGPTIVYAYLQSTGVVNDHVVSLLPVLDA